MNSCDRAWTEEIQVKFFFFSWARAHKANLFLAPLKVLTICQPTNVSHMDIQIEQSVDPKIQLKRKLRSHNSCILSIPSTDRHAASRGTNLPSSLFDFIIVNIKYFIITLPCNNEIFWRFTLKKKDQMFLIYVFFEKSFRFDA